VHLSAQAAVMFLTRSSPSQPVIGSLSINFVIPIRVITFAFINCISERRTGWAYTSKSMQPIYEPISGAGPLLLTSADTSTAEKLQASK
jgi:hypothetical protein